MGSVWLKKPAAPAAMARFGMSAESACVQTTTRMGDSWSRSTLISFSAPSVGSDQSMTRMSLGTVSAVCRQASAELTVLTRLKRPSDSSISDSAASISELPSAMVTSILDFAGLVSVTFIVAFTCYASIICLVAIFCPVAIICSVSFASFVSFIFFVAFSGLISVIALFQRGDWFVRA